MHHLSKLKGSRGPPRAGKSGGAGGERGVGSAEPDPGEDGWVTVDLLEPFAGVWLTNRNHGRAAAAFRRYGLTVWAHAADADRLEAGVDERVTGGTTIAGDIEIVPVPGKSPGEIAFHLPRSGAVIVGDLVIGVPAGELSSYPDEVIDDRPGREGQAAGVRDALPD